MPFKIIHIHTTVINSGRAHRPTNQRPWLWPSPKWPKMCRVGR